MISLSYGAGRLIAWGWSLASKAWKLAKQHPKEAIVACMAAFALACLILARIAIADRDSWKSKVAALTAQYETAQAAAAAAAETARIKSEAASAANARKADHEIPPSLAPLRAAADRYADSRSLRAQVPSCPSGTAVATAQDVVAPDRDRSSPDAVVIPRADFDQLRDNTLRLERVRIWAASEIEAGRAVKVDE